LSQESTLSKAEEKQILILPLDGQIINDKLTESDQKNIYLFQATTGQKITIDMMSKEINSVLILAKINIVHTPEGEKKETKKVAVDIRAILWQFWVRSRGNFGCDRVAILGAILWGFWVRFCGGFGCDRSFQKAGFVAQNKISDFLKKSDILGAISFATFRERIFFVIAIAL
jgi:hypothetical protein